MRAFKRSSVRAFVRSCECMCVRVRISPSSDPPRCPLLKTVPPQRITRHKIIHRDPFIANFTSQKRAHLQAAFASGDPIESEPHSICRPHDQDYFETTWIRETHGIDGWIHDDPWDEKASARTCPGIMPGNAGAAAGAARTE